MSGDTFTEVTNESWFSRIRGAFKGIIIGVIFILLAFPVLFWNEGRAVKRYKTLKEGSGAVVTISADSVDQSNNGKLVHLSGVATTDEVLSDPIFGVSGTAIKLLRKVEMYQWEEDSESHTKKKTGGGTETTTTYSYEKVWDDSLISSGDFKKPGHDNPASMPYKTQEQVAGIVTIGAFTLSPSLIGKIDSYTPVSLAGDTAIPESSQASLKLQGNGFYAGANPASPQIGDVRVTFKTVDPAEVSLVSKQQGASFEPYQAKTGGLLELLKVGSYSADEMFAQAHQENKILTWILRGLGFLLMLIGFNMVFKLLSVLADVLPFLGNIVAAGTGFIAFLLSLILSTTTIAIAWIVYRPLLGIALLVIVAGLVILIRKKMKAATPADMVPAGS